MPKKYLQSLYHIKSCYKLVILILINVVCIPTPAEASFTHCTYKCIPVRQFSYVCLEIVLKGTFKVDTSVVIPHSFTFVSDNRRSLIRVAIIIHLLMNSEVGLQHDNFTASLNLDALLRCISARVFSCRSCSVRLYQNAPACFQAVCEDPADAPKPE